MTSGGAMRERHVWIGVVAVLATSLAWLGAIALVLVVKPHADALPALLVALRATLRAGVLLATRFGGTALPAAILVSGVLASALRRGRTLEGVRHV